MHKRVSILLVIAIISPIVGLGQRTITKEELAGQENAILTTVPFLNIAPDSRGGSMGDAGAATSPDANSSYWNLAKYAFIDKKGGASFSYIPWLRHLGINDINLLYLSGYYRLKDKRQALSMSLRYFSLGNIIFTDNTGNTISDNNNPYEMAISGGYSLKLTDYWSAGIGFRFILSDLKTQIVAGSKAGKAGAADFGVYYQKDVQLSDKKAQAAYGICFSNMGSKISYSESKDPEFIPTNLRMGGRLSVNMDDYNMISVTLDLNKLLVPTPDTAGLTPNVGTPAGMVQSFYDAPGGFKEELHEIMYSVGAEYSYQNQFMVRAGYFYEHETKGNRKYVTLGVGVRFNVLTTDFSYLIATSDRDSPIANTVRFSLLFNVGDSKDKKKAIN